MTPGGALGHAHPTATLAQDHRRPDAPFHSKIGDSHDGRRELDELQRQAHQSIAARSEAIDLQRDELEQERRQIAGERQRAPVVAEAIRFAAGLIVCALPLVVVIYLLRSLRSPDDTDPAMVELLVEELASEQPRFLPGPGNVPSLPGTSAPEGDAGQAAIEGDVPADP